MKTSNYIWIGAGALVLLLMVTKKKATAAPQEKKQTTSGGGGGGGGSFGGGTIPPALPPVVNVQQNTNSTKDDEEDRADMTTPTTQTESMAEKSTFVPTNEQTKADINKDYDQSGLSGGTGLGGSTTVSGGVVSGGSGLGTGVVTEPTSPATVVSDVGIGGGAALPQSGAVTGTGSISGAAVVSGNLPSGTIGVDGRKKWFKNAAGWDDKLNVDKWNSQWN